MSGAFGGGSNRRNRETIIAAARTKNWSKPNREYRRRVLIALYELGGEAREYRIIEKSGVEKTTVSRYLSHMSVEGLVLLTRRHSYLRAKLTWEGHEAVRAERADAMRCVGPTDSDSE